MKTTANGTATAKVDTGNEIVNATAALPTGWNEPKGDTLPEWAKEGARCTINHQGDKLIPSVGTTRSQRGNKAFPAWE